MAIIAVLAGVALAVSWVRRRRAERRNALLASRFASAFSEFSGSVPYTDSQEVDSLDLWGKQSVEPISISQIAARPRPQYRRDNSNEIPLNLDDSAASFDGSAGDIELVVHDDLARTNGARSRNEAPWVTNI